MKKNFLLWGALLLALPLLGGCLPRQQMSITFGGDVMLAREGQALFHANPWGVLAVPERQGDSSVGENLFFVNLESPLGEPAPSEGYNLCADVDQGQWLAGSGLDLAVAVNNHTEDCAGENLASQALRAYGIVTLDQAYASTFLETAIGRVGLVAAEDVRATVDEALLLEQVAQARRRCEILIVSMHWGNEYQASPSARQQALAQKLADAGVDILWGHHPHVLQQIAWVHSVDGHSKMLTMYSLGNLLSDQWMTPDTQRTALLTVNFDKRGIESLSVLPLRMERASRSLMQADAEDALKIWQRLGAEQLSDIQTDLQDSNKK